MSGEGRLQNFSVDQAAGAVVLVVGSIAGLIQVIWISKCHCRCNLCYIFQCERKPPSEEEMKRLHDQIKEKKEKKGEKSSKKETQKKTDKRKKVEENEEKRKRIRRELE